MDDRTSSGGQAGGGDAGKTSRTALLLMVLALIPLVLWPANSWWQIDEPRLIARAWHANNDHILSPHGLTGNFRVMYGPMPTHLYQLLLCITHDLDLIVIMRALIAGISTAAALLWLARSARLPAWFAAAIMVAPMVSLYQRVLWDASFTIPLGTLALAAFAAFLRTGGKWPLRIALAAGFLASINHPQALPVFIPIAGLLVWRHRGAIRADKRGLLWTAAPVLALNGAYLVLLVGNIVWLFTAAPPTSYPGDGSRAESALAPLLGGNILTGWGIRPPLPDWIGEPVQWATRLIYPLIWLGIAAAAVRAPSVIRAWRKGEREPDVRDAIGVTALAGLALQLLLCVAGRIPFQPQYFFGTFALHAFFAMLGVDVLRRVKLGFAVGAAFGIASAVVTVGVGWVAEHRRDDPPGWPSIRDAREIVESINKYADAPVFTDIALLAKYPQSIRTMRLLMPQTPGASLLEAPGLLITYERRGGIQTGRMVVRVLAPGERPPGSTEFDAAPLPRDWAPPERDW